MHLHISSNASRFGLVSMLFHITSGVSRKGRKKWVTTFWEEQQKRREGWVRRERSNLELLLALIYTYHHPLPQNRNILIIIFFLEKRNLAANLHRILTFTFTPYRISLPLRTTLRSTKYFQNEGRAELPCFGSTSQAQATYAEL